ncbi:MAG: NAD(P)-binding domain-containing protein [Bacteroidetes bacterium]|nr:NAD(P)-binding domain-containing protein [Bacteroidota bacterium]
MNIAILGAGNVATALAQRWNDAGHSVVIGVRDPASEKSQKAQALLPRLPFKPLQDAAQLAEVLVICTPPDAVITLKDLLSANSDKIIIDTSNAVRTRPEPYPTAFHYIKGETKAQKVVKCFNTTGFENMANPVYQGEGIDMFCAGNDALAKETARALALDAGFSTCWDFGGDDKVELLEKLALSWINLAIMQGNGRNIAFRVVRRP